MDDESEFCRHWWRRRWCKVWRCAVDVSGLILNIMKPPHSTMRTPHICTLHVFPATGINIVPLLLPQHYSVNLLNVIPKLYCTISINSPWVWKFWKFMNPDLESVRKTRSNLIFWPLCDAWPANRMKWYSISKYFVIRHELNYFR